MTCTQNALHSQWKSTTFDRMSSNYKLLTQSNHESEVMRLFDKLSEIS